MRLRRILREERGAELVEFALMSFAFFLIVFGTIEFSRMIWQDNVVASAAKDGARWAAVRGTASGSPVDAAAVQTYVQSRAAGLTVTVTTTWSPDQNAGSIVTVAVLGSFQPLVPLLPSSAISLRSTCQMVMAR